MDNFDLSILNDIYNKYSILEMNANQALNCLWEDSVHDSFERYIRDLKQIGEELKSIDINTQDELSIIQSLKLKDIPNETDYLDKEVENL